MKGYHVKFSKEKKLKKHKISKNTYFFIKWYKPKQFLNEWCTKFSWGAKKKLFFPRAAKKNKSRCLEWLNDQWTFPRKKKKPGNFSLRLEISEKNHTFVSGTFCFVTGANDILSRAVLQNSWNLSRPLFVFHGLFFFCDGQNTHFHWQNFGFFVTGTFKKLKSTFSRSITGTENCHGKRKKQTLLSLTRIKRFWWRNRNTTVLSLFSY